MLLFVCLFGYGVLETAGCFMGFFIIILQFGCYLFPIFVYLHVAGGQCYI